MALKKERAMMATAALQKWDASPRIDGASWVPAPPQRCPAYATRTRTEVRRRPKTRVAAPAPSRGTPADECGPCNNSHTRTTS
mmetsp:Transcript_34465/g.72570  ORF Transcript_34465/g.72570 Transcript_34465/m.72570 type:complete len:83 (-) Transcript_34465:3-251(-)|eukprot:3111702-Pleurochrysis_carterae.AAC.1